MIKKKTPASCVLRITVIRHEISSAFVLFQWVIPPSVLKSFGRNMGAKRVCCNDCIFKRLRGLSKCLASEMPFLCGVLLIPIRNREGSFSV